MDITTFSFSPEQLQATLNNAKDDLIELINQEHGLQLNPCEYVFVLHTRGSLGRMWDKLLGKPPQDQSVRVVLRVHLPRPGAPKSAS